MSRCIKKNNLVMLKISIVVPSFNQGNYLEETFRSIIGQGYPCVEIIVMDGGSTDNSVDVIKKYEKYITYWQSQKDNGQSDAINSGFRKATGDYVTWLNSDDVLLPGALLNIAKTIEKHPDVNWFLGNVLWMNKIGNIIRVGKVEKECWFWNKRFLFSNGGPTAIMKRDYLLEIGALREDFHYMMDTELWYRYVSLGNKFVRINSYCWGLRLHEQAKMSGHNFSDSPLANKNHPSWIQKHKENDFLKVNYPINQWLEKIWRVSKIFTRAFYSRYFDKKLLGTNYKSL